MGNTQNKEGDKQSLVKIIDFVATNYNLKLSLNLQLYNQRFKSIVNVSLNQITFIFNYQNLYRRLPNT